MRVFLDTDVLVSAMATRGLCADLLRVVLPEHELVIGESVLVELRRTLRTKFHLSADILHETEEFFRREASVAREATPLQFHVGDPDDIVVLGQAVTAQADIFVTGDRHLLDVAKDAPLPIVTPREFWHRLRSEPASSG